MVCWKISYYCGGKKNPVFFDFILWVLFRLPYHLMALHYLLTNKWTVTFSEHPLFILSISQPKSFAPSPNFLLLQFWYRFPIANFDACMVQVLYHHPEWERTSGFVRVSKLVAWPYLQDLDLISNFSCSGSFLHRVYVPTRMPLRLHNTPPFYRPNSDALAILTLFDYQELIM